MRQFLRGWALNTTGLYKKEKKRLSRIIEELDMIAESRVFEVKNQSNEQIAKLLHEEEIKWYQRSKSQFILEGDNNTRYFHMLANGMYRKKRIMSLDQKRVNCKAKRPCKNT